MRVSFFLLDPSESVHLMLLIASLCVLGRHFVMNLPGDWQWRHTLQNILRVAWMDIFERAGWSIVSMWNCNASASNSSLLGLVHSKLEAQSLQLTSMHCNTLRRTRTQCNTLPRVRVQLVAAWTGIFKTRGSTAATHNHTLQHTATHCITLQHTASHCNTSVSSSSLL